MTKKLCPKCKDPDSLNACAGAPMRPISDAEFRPFWECCNCGLTIPRRVLNTKKRRERKAEFDRIVWKYKLDEASQ